MDRVKEPRRRETAVEVRLRPLTVLRDEGDAAVHDDGDVAPAQLLLPQRVPFPSRGPLDVRVPQGEVGPAHALQVQSSAGQNRPGDEDQTSEPAKRPAQEPTCPSPPAPGRPSSRGSRRPT